MRSMQKNVLCVINYKTLLIFRILRDANTQKKLVENTLN